LGELLLFKNLYNCQITFIFVCREGLDIRPALQSDDSSELPANLVTLLGDKRATHRLQDEYTDVTKSLVMLGP
jgi:hypothetical protein